MGRTISNLGPLLYCITQMGKHNTIIHYHTVLDPIEVGTIIDFVLLHQISTVH